MELIINSKIKQYSNWKGISNPITHLIDICALFSVRYIQCINFNFGMGKQPLTC